jgi:hypothetical protein
VAGHDGALAAVKGANSRVASRLSEGWPLGDEHVLLGMLSVPESVAARVLGELGVTFEEAAEAIVEAGL